MITSTPRPPWPAPLAVTRLRRGSRVTGIGCRVPARSRSGCCRPDPRSPLPSLDPEARLLVGVEVVDGALGEGGNGTALEAEAAIIQRRVQRGDVPVAHVLERLGEPFHQVGHVI